MSKKKIALVTGADSGLGREFVRKLLEEDVEEIWAVARNKEKLEKLIYDYGKRIKIFPLDLTVRENFAHANSQCNKINIFNSSLFQHSRHGINCTARCINIINNYNRI